MNETPPKRIGPPDAVLIVNARSRKGQVAFDTAVRALREAGITLTAAHALKDPSKLQPMVRAAVKSGTPMVIVGGGDGSLSCAVDAFVGTDCRFGILPLGTANSFARTLGIPIDVAGAVGVIAAGHSRRVDIGAIDGDHFCNAASLGLSPMIGQSVPHLLKRYMGRPGYLLWALWCLARFKSFVVTVEGDGEPQTFKALEVRIANGPYHGGIEVVDDADVDTGRIVIEAVSGRARTTLISNWLRLLFGLPKRERQVRRFEGRSLRLLARPEQPISIDGEVTATTPATIEVAAHAVTVLVPAG